LARRHGISEEVLQAIEDPDRCPVSDAEREVLRFAEEMTLRPREVGEAGIARLREYFREEQIVELACVIGLFNYLNRFAEALGMWPTRPGEGGPDEDPTD
jgi:alkylhydroperoxidase family enzyme